MVCEGYIMMIFNVKILYATENYNFLIWFDLNHVIK